MGGFNAGSVSVMLGFTVDDSGADKYDRRTEDIRRRAAKPIKQAAALDVDDRSFREHALKSKAVEGSNLKVRESQLKLEAATKQAAAAEAKHGRESLEYRRAALQAEKASHGLAESQDQLERQVKKVARTMATDASRANEAYVRGINGVDRATDRAEQSTHRLARGADKADRDVGRLRVGMGRFAGISASVATGIAGSTVALVGAVAASTGLVDAYQESYKVSQQTEAVIKSTGSAAKVTAEEVGDLATALSRKTGIDDEAIQSGSNLLLTFKNIKNEVGAGNDIFDQANATLVDMSAALGTDVKGSAVQLGKALNDPIKGVAALGRVGVTFTADQKKQIAALVESGKTMEAQKIILRELNSEFGGSAEAQATNTDRMKVSLGNLAETIGGKLAPIAEKASGVISRFVDDLADGKGDAGKFADAASRVGDRVKSMASTVGDAVGSVVGWFRRLYRENKDTIGEIGSTLRSMASSVGRALGKIKDGFADTFGGRSGTSRDVRKIIGTLLDFSAIVAKVYRAVAERALPGIVAAFTGFARLVRGVVKVVAGILTLDFRKAWDGVKDIFGGAMKGIGGLLRAGTAPLRAGASALGRAVSGPLGSIWTGIKSAWRSGLDFILGGVSTASGAIAKLLDAASHLPFVGGKFKGLAESVRKGQKAIDDYRESLRKTDKEHARTANIKKLQEEVGGLRSKLKTLKKGSDDYRDTAEKLRSKQRTLNKAVSEGQESGKKGAKGVKAIGDAGGHAATAVYQAGVSITGNLDALAKGAGIKPPSWAIKPAKSIGLGVGVYAPGTADLAEATENAKRYAVGGIPNPGSGARDDHMLIDPLGRPVALMSGTEGIINAPQMPYVDHALRVASMIGESPFSSLDDLWSSGMRHYATGGQLGTPRFAGGGGIVPVPGFPGERAASSVIPQIESIARRWHLTLTDAYGPGHKSPGHTQTGTAADFVGSDAAMDAAVRYLVAQGYVVGYDGRYGSMDWPGHGPAAGQGGSNAHLHVELGGKGGKIAGGGAGVSIGQVKAPKVVGPAGPMTNIIRGAGKHMAKSANKWLAKHAPAASPDPAGGGKTSAGGKYNKASLRSLWASANPGNGDPNLMAAIGLAESSGDPNSIGIPTSGGRARGLWQIMWPLHQAEFPGRNPFNPQDNAVMAGSILKSEGLGAWEAYTRGMHRQFLNKGGLLRRFSGGGATGKKPKGKKKPSFKESTLAGAGLGKSTMRSLNSKQTDRVGDYDHIQELIDTDDRRYGLQERKNDQTEEVLIDEETGAVNEGDVKRRAAELHKLEVIKKRVLSRLRKGRKIAKRVQKTYSTIIKRLKAAVKAATAGKKGKSSKARREAAKSYRAQIKDYLSRRKEWRGKEQDIGFDIADVDLDLDALKGERSGVLGTKAEPPEADDPDPAEGDTSSGGESPDDSGNDAGSTGSGDSPTPETLPPSAEDIARGVAEQLSNFQAGRADLFASFGSNFAAAGSPAALMADPGAQAAGVRYFGGSTGGTDGGVIAGAGGTTIEALNVQFTGPQPADPHVMTATIMHEIQASG